MKSFELVTNLIELQIYDQLSRVSLATSRSKQHGCFVIPAFLVVWTYAAGSGYLKIRDLKPIYFTVLKTQVKNERLSMNDLTLREPWERAETLRVPKRS